MKARFLRLTSVLLFVTGLAAACDTESSRSSLPTSPSTPAVTVNSVRLTGPDTVYLGEASQFTATAQRSDGTSVDVTAQASWRTFNSGLMTMSAPGLFTGRGSGETGISVSFGGRNATMSSVIVVPRGTYRLKGTIRDSGVPVDAHLEITNAAFGEREFDIGPLGLYVVYGVAGDTRIKVTKPGYEEFLRTEAVTGHSTIDVDLRLQRPRPDVSGTYTLTITAADECAALPDEVRTRTYSASIRQTGPELLVKLKAEGQTGGSTRDEFTGVLEAERAVFRFQPAGGFYYYYYYPFLTELVSGNYYGLDGVATTSISSNELAGTLNGGILTYSTLFRLVASCRSTDHRFQFRR